jgi:chorismate-pyruvate lyase
MAEGTTGGRRGGRAASQGRGARAPDAARAARDAARDPAALLHPLADLYRAARLALPRVEAVVPAALPPPWRALLARRGALTPRLERHHGGPIALRVLARRRRRGVYTRQVLLVRAGDARAVGLGAIEVRLAGLAPGTRARLLAERVPLGRLVDQEGRRFSFRSGPLLRVRPDALIGGALGAAGGRWLYGRRSTLVDGRARAVAEIVEVLAPDLG